MNINEIVSGFQIIGHRIKSLVLNNEFVFFDSEDESIQREIFASYELSDPFDVDNAEDSIGGIVTLYIDTKTFNEENTASVHLELEGGFILKGSRDVNQLNAMLAVNGCAALYSIGRGIISGVTSQMSINGSGTIMIPMINAFEFRNEVENISEE